MTTLDFEKDAEVSLDPDMAARSMKAYEDGDWQEIEDVIKELQSMDLAQILNELGHRHVNIDVRAKQFHQDDQHADMYRLEVIEDTDTWCGTGRSWEQAFIDLLHKMREHIKTEYVNTIPTPAEAACDECVEEEQE